jgi:predicted small metal-binding protein
MGETDEHIKSQHDSAIVPDDSLDETQTPAKKLIAVSKCSYFTSAK